MKIHLRGGGEDMKAEVTRKNDLLTVLIGDKLHEFNLISGEVPDFLVSKQGTILRGEALTIKHEVFLHLPGTSRRFEVIDEETADSGDSSGGDLRVIAPMPGTIIKVLVEKGDEVKKGQSLVIVEAMKMENEVRASGDATVENVLVSAGERVGFGQELLKLVPPQVDGGQAESS